METTFLEVKEDYKKAVSVLVELSKDYKKYSNLSTFSTLLKNSVLKKLVDFEEMENMLFVVLETDSEVKPQLVEKYGTITEEQYNKNRVAVETFIEAVRNYNSTL